MSWIPLAILSAFSAGLVAIFGKLGLAGVDSTLATAVRAVVMALFLLAVAAALGKFNQLGSLSSRAITFIVLSGLAGALSWLFYFLALKLGPVTGVASLDRLSVVFAVLLAALFLGEALTLKVVLGLLLLVAGAVLLVI